MRWTVHPNACNALPSPTKGKLSPREPIVTTITCMLVSPTRPFRNRKRLPVDLKLRLLPDNTVPVRIRTPWPVHLRLYCNRLEEFGRVALAAPIQASAGSSHSAFETKNFSAVVWPSLEIAVLEASIGANPPS